MYELQSHGAVRRAAAVVKAMTPAERAVVDLAKRHERFRRESGDPCICETCLAVRALGAASKMTQREAIEACARAGCAACNCGDEAHRDLHFAGAVAVANRILIDGIRDGNAFTRAVLHEAARPEIAAALKGE